MQYIVIAIDSEVNKCGKCAHLKYGRCDLFQKPYGEVRSMGCIGQDVTDYASELMEQLVVENIDDFASDKQQ